MSVIRPGPVVPAVGITERIEKSRTEYDIICDISC